MVKISYSKPSEPALLDDYLRELTGRGKVYLPSELPADLGYGRPGECFSTCLLAALGSNGKYLYCEGIGVLFDEAYAHAWLTDADGEVAYDLTWRVENGVTGKSSAVPAFYKGVVLDLEACKKMVLSTGRGGIIANRELRPGLFKNVLKRSNISG
jgi:hypothetical protein